MRLSEWRSVQDRLSVSSNEQEPEPDTNQHHLSMALGVLKEIEHLGDVARDLRVFCEEWARQAREGTAESWIAPKRKLLGQMIESLGVLYARPLEGAELREAIVEEMNAMFPPGCAALDKTYRANVDPMEVAGRRAH